MLEFIIDILCESLPHVLLVLGIFISYRILNLADLTCEGTFTLGGAATICGILIGVPPFVSTLIGALAGFLFGMITGILHTKLKINALLAGIITLTALVSVNMLIMGLANNKLFDTSLRLGDEKTIFLPVFERPDYNAILVSLLIDVGIVFFLYWLFGTEFGMSMRVTGMNPAMAKSQGINTETMIIIGLALSNGLIALGGSLFAQHRTTSDIQGGAGTLIIGLSSIILGESLFGKKTFKNWLVSVAAGAVSYHILVKTALFLGLPHVFLQLLYAVMIVVIFAAGIMKEKKAHKKKGKICLN